MKDLKYAINFVIKIKVINLLQLEFILTITLLVKSNV